MTAHTAVAPEGMSYVNAFRALWENSQPASFFRERPETLPRQEAVVGTSEKVVQFFKNLPGTYVDYAGGRLIKTDFSEYPKLAVVSYDRQYGIGAAQKALDAYNQTPKDRRFDKNDACRFSDISQHPRAKL